MLQAWEKYNILVGKPESENHSEGLDIDARMMLE
jgi:hypothetical protein